MGEMILCVIAFLFMAFVLIRIVKIPQSRPAIPMLVGGMAASVCLFARGIVDSPDVSRVLLYATGVCLLPPIIIAFVIVKNQQRGE